MRNEGWTLADLAGELHARGVDIDDVSDAEIWRVIERQGPEQAADDIAHERGW